MSWSLTKEAALRRLTAMGVPYDVALTKLSAVPDDAVQQVVRELRADQERGA